MAAGFFFAVNIVDGFHKVGNCPKRKPHGEHQPECQQSIVAALCDMLNGKIQKRYHIFRQETGDLSIQCQCGQMQKPQKRCHKNKKREHGKQEVVCHGSGVAPHLIVKIPLNGQQDYFLPALPFLNLSM